MATLSPVMRFLAEQTTPYAPARCPDLGQHLHATSLDKAAQEVPAPPR